MRFLALAALLLLASGCATMEKAGKVFCGVKWIAERLCDENPTDDNNRGISRFEAVAPWRAGGPGDTDRGYSGNGGPRDVDGGCGSIGGEIQAAGAVATGAVATVATWAGAAAIANWSSSTRAKIARLRV